MRKIILTGAVLAMLTSAAPMVHAIDNDVQQALDKKVDKDKYDAEIQKLEGKLDKANDLDKKIDNIGNSFNQYQTQNNEKVDKKLDKDELQGELTKQKVAINEDVKGKIEQAKKDLKADIEEKVETQRNRIDPLKSIAESNQNLLIGADKKSGLKKDVENNKKLLVGDDGKSGLQKDVKDLKRVVGENDTEGLQKSVKENTNKITQAENNAQSAKDESAAASRLALEVKQKIDAMANGQNDVKKDIAELGGRINVTGAMSAALAGLKPLQYDPMAPTQVMGSVSTYEGQQAYALGLAHFTSEDLMVHGGVSFTNSHKYMANVGVTYKFGHSAEKSMIPMRYQAGPISSIYVMQKENEMMREKMAQQEERIAQLEEMIMNMKK